MRWPALLSPSRWPLPGGCWICRDWSGERLCAACCQRFAPVQPRCPRCALPQPAPQCASCLREPLPLGAVQAALDYLPPWDGLIQACKFRQQLGLLPALAALHPGRLPPGARLLPVPPHPARLGERGFDLTALLAAEWSQRGAPWQPGLQRLLDTPPQTRLTRRERLKNLRHAFRLAPGFQPQGLHCVLVDDVMTTGATLATLAALLLQAGASQVDAWVLARTPDPQA